MWSDAANGARYLFDASKRWPDLGGGATSVASSRPNRGGTGPPLVGCDLVFRRLRRLPVVAVASGGCHRLVRVVHASRVSGKIRDGAEGWELGVVGRRRRQLRLRRPPLPPVTRRAYSLPHASRQSRSAPHFRQSFSSAAAAFFAYSRTRVHFSICFSRFVSPSRTPLCPSRVRVVRTAAAFQYTYSYPSYPHIRSYRIARPARRSPSKSVKISSSRRVCHPRLPILDSRIFRSLRATSPPFVASQCHLLFSVGSFVFISLSLVHIRPLRLSSAVSHSPCVRRRRRRRRRPNSYPRINRRGAISTPSPTSAST